MDRFGLNCVHNPRIPLEPDNLLLGFLGSHNALNKNLLQLLAVASAKHSDIKATVYALVDTAATHCFVHCNLVAVMVHLPNKAMEWECPLRVIPMSHSR
jgi:hypothetical protein